MYIIVFEKDKEKLIANGYRLISETVINSEKGYIFQDKNKLNFEKEKIEYFRTAKVCL